MNRIDKKTYKIALSGICLALSVISLFLAGTVPGAEMTLYAVSGFFTGIVILETGVKGGIGLYVASVILSFVVVPNKIAIIPYVFFFGIYGFIKYFAEKLQNVVLQIGAKVSAFVIVFGIAFWGFKELFFGNINLPDAPVWLMAIGGIAMFVLYDYIYTLAIVIYRKRIKREIVEFNLSGEKDGDEKRQSK